MQSLSDKLSCQEDSDPKPKCLEEANISWASWKRLRPSESFEKGTFHCVKLAMDYVVCSRLPAWRTGIHAMVYFGDEAVCESFILLYVTSHHIAICDPNETQWFTRLDISDIYMISQGLSTTYTYKFLQIFPKEACYLGANGIHAPWPWSLMIHSRIAYILFPLKWEMC